MDAYVQDLRFRGYRRVEVVDGHLDVTLRGRGYSDRYKVDLAGLDPIPTRSSRRNHTWIGWASCCGLIGGLFFWGAISHGKFTIGSAITAMIGIVFFWLAFRFFILSRNTNYDMVFYRFDDGEHAFSLFLRPDSDSEFRGFMDGLAERITSAKESKSTDRAPVLGDGLASELQRLTDLHQKGVLSDSEFAEAKSLLLRAPSESRQIGFH